MVASRMLVVMGPTVMQAKTVETSSIKIDV
jgi:hypothetical protein